ncbi:hypothetical protein RhiirB3_458838, partial [Rhizophagus irregularis]
MGLMGSSTFPLLLQVTSTNSLESFHSELKKITSLLNGAVQNIVNIDYKKKSEAEIASFDDLIIKEACAVMNRLEKGKGVP